jgi:hypothetical protein
VVNDQHVYWSFGGHKLEAKLLFRHRNHRRKPFELDILSPSAPAQFQNFVLPESPHPTTATNLCVIYRGL